MRTSEPGLTVTIMLCYNDVIIQTLMRNYKAKNMMRKCCLDENVTFTPHHLIPTPIYAWWKNIRSLGKYSSNNTFVMLYIAWSRTIATEEKILV